MSLAELAPILIAIGLFVFCSALVSPTRRIAQASVAIGVALWVVGYWLAYAYPHSIRTPSECRDYASIGYHPPDCPP